jgi:predicted dehydrogenase
MANRGGDVTGAKLPLAVIGAGSIGQRHIGVAQLSDAVDLVAVVEPHEGLRNELAARGLPMVARIDDVPSQVRAAIIATPTQDHYASSRACFSRDWVVMVEKPTAGTLDDGRALVAEAAAKGLPFFTGHHRRCHPFCVAAQQTISSLGELVGVQGLWSLRKHASYYDVDWRRKPGAGPLLTNLSHEVDLLRFLVGDMEEVTTLLSSARRGLEIEDSAAMAFRFANGALGSFLMSDTGASPWAFESATGENPAIAVSGQDYIQITGTEGALSFPSLKHWGRGGPGEIEWSKPLRAEPGPQCAMVDPLREQIGRFAKVVAGGTDAVLCSGEDGVKALEMTLAAALSGRIGRPVKAEDVPGDFTGV